MGSAPCSGRNSEIAASSFVDFRVAVNRQPPRPTFFRKLQRDFFSPGLRSPKPARRSSTAPLAASGGARARRHGNAIVILAGTPERQGRQALDARQVRNRTGRDARAGPAGRQSVWNRHQGPAGTPAPAALDATGTRDRQGRQSGGTGTRTPPAGTPAASEPVPGTGSWTPERQAPASPGRHRQLDRLSKAGRHRHQGPALGPASRICAKKWRGLFRAIR